MEKKVKEHTNEDFEENYKAGKKERMESETRLLARIEALEERLRVAEERARVAEERARVAEERARIAEEKLIVVEEKLRVAENERDIIRQMYEKQYDELAPPVLQGKNFYDEWKRKWKMFILYNINNQNSRK